MTEPETLTGVDGEFRASHDDPRGQKRRHWHTWQVTAWFPAGSDARDWLHELDLVLGRLDGRHLEPEYAWGEPLAKMIGEFMADCVEVDISRPGERIRAKWQAPRPPAWLADRSDEKRAELVRLYKANLTFKAIARRIGGTPDGVRSTIRKMIERGDLTRRPNRQGRAL
jgi:DNA-binding CsgD family transcriptional regulator